MFSGCQVLALKQLQTVEGTHRHKAVIWFLLIAIGSGYLMSCVWCLVLCLVSCVLSCVLCLVLCLVSGVLSCVLCQVSCVWCPVSGVL